MRFPIDKHHDFHSLISLTRAGLQIFPFTEAPTLTGKPFLKPIPTKSDFWHLLPFFHFVNSVVTSAPLSRE